MYCQAFLDPRSGKCLPQQRGPFYRRLAFAFSSFRCARKASSRVTSQERVDVSDGGMGIGGGTVSNGLSNAGPPASQMFSKHPLAFCGEALWYRRVSGMEVAGEIVGVLLPLIHGGHAPPGKRTVQ
jgi:hypothetical protein